mmetsp:Transcript_4808/g.11878  ORF Transcript_4808/g.11878 Transcript_4808/m.11878 type:complete len:267 (-) Transcript_4808:122-922(-)
MHSNSLRGRGTSLRCRTAACVSSMASTSAYYCWTLRAAIRIASRGCMPRLASPSQATCSTWQSRLGRTASHAAASPTACSSARSAASAAATASCTGRSAWCSQASCCSSPSGATAASPSSSARASASCGTSVPRSTRTATRWAAARRARWMSRVTSRCTRARSSSPTRGTIASTCTAWRTAPSVAPLAGAVRRRASSPTPPASMWPIAASTPPNAWAARPIGACRCSRSTARLCRSCCRRATAGASRGAAASCTASASTLAASACG